MATEEALATPPQNAPAKEGPRLALAHQGSYVKNVKKELRIILYVKINFFETGTIWSLFLLRMYYVRSMYVIRMSVCMFGE